MEIVNNLEECKKIYDKYTFKESLWDETEIIFSFFDENLYELYFMVFDHGILPLQLDKSNKTYYFFGGSYPENRKLLFDKNKLKEVYEKLPTPCKLFDINHKEILETVGEISEDYRYFIHLKNFLNVEDYLKTFSKKHRYNILSDLKKLSHLRLEWTKEINLDKIKEFNIMRFGHDSDFSDKEMYDEFLNLIKTTKKFIYCLNIYNENELVALEFAIFFKNKYYIINGGYDRKIKNLGKLLIFEHIKKAFELNSHEIDFLVGDSGWKELWNLEKEKVITIKKL